MCKQITGVSELIEALREDNSSYGGDVWYRGQSVSEWTLSPGLFRYAGNSSEESLIARFKQSAAMLTNHIPNNDFDWLFLMQHYGVPTRLLDWSESPLVALYFCVNERSHDGTDAALWSLKPTNLNLIASIKTDEKNYIPSFDSSFLQNYTVETVSSNPRTQLSPCATIATRNNARIQSQLGVFTIHHLDRKPIEDFCTSDEIIKYEIPAAAKEPIRNELKLLCISKFTLFPELASIGELVKAGIL